MLNAIQQIHFNLKLAEGLSVQFCRWHACMTFRCPFQPSMQPDSLQRNRDRRQQGKAQHLAAYHSASNVHQAQRNLRGIVFRMLDQSGTACASPKRCRILGLETCILQREQPGWQIRWVGPSEAPMLIPCLGSECVTLLLVALGGKDWGRACEFPCVVPCGDPCKVVL